jgi:hypothetical protein
MRSENTLKKEKKNAAGKATNFKGKSLEILQSRFIPQTASHSIEISLRLFRNDKKTVAIRTERVNGLTYTHTQNPGQKIAEKIRIKPFLAI